MPIVYAKVPSIQVHVASCRQDLVHLKFWSKGMHVLQPNRHMLPFSGQYNTNKYPQQLLLLVYELYTST